ncbi:hypothetical protein [Nonomuraea insulae]|uniref:Uncharacterized protein n=1 Tax=Nonomuraea insulae TaxID=1616787 RepID=A0ABW1CUJ4_9ACTN
MVSRVGKAVVWLSAGLLLSAAVPASAQASGWQASYQDGIVRVPADRSGIKVCDGRADGRVYQARWAHDNKVPVGGVFEVRAPQGGCAGDDSIWGKVMVFKLCWGHLGHNKRVVWERCGAPQWLTAKPSWWKKK